MPIRPKQICCCVKCSPPYEWESEKVVPDRPLKCPACGNTKWWVPRTKSLAEAQENGRRNKKAALAPQRTREPMMRQVLRDKRDR